MNKLDLSYILSGALIIFLIVLPVKSHCADAPKTVASQQTICPNTAITIPLKVANFNDIWGITLNIIYDSTVMIFNDGTTTKNPSLSSATIHSNPFQGTSKRISISWFNSFGVYLSDSSIIFTIGFNYNSGNTAFTFDNSTNNGHDCEYARYITNPPDIIQLIDTPTINYYYNGHVNQVPLPPGTPRTWTGSISTDWANSNNWHPCGVPAPTEDVVIPDLSNKPIIGTAGLSCHDIQVQSYATLTVNAGFSCHNIEVYPNGTLEVDPAGIMTITGVCTIDP